MSIIFTTEPKEAYRSVKFGNFSRINFLSISAVQNMRKTCESLLVIVISNLYVSSKERAVCLTLHCMPDELESRCGIKYKNFMPRMTKISSLLNKSTAVLKNKQTKRFPASCPALLDSITADNDSEVWHCVSFSFFRLPQLIWEIILHIIIIPVVFPNVSIFIFIQPRPIWDATEGYLQH